MKIAVISSQVFAVPPPGYSGLEMVAYYCAKGLAQLGHQVSLIAPYGSICPGVDVISCGPPGQWDEKKGFDHYWKRLFQFDCLIDHSWQKFPYLLKQEGVLKNETTGREIPSLGVLHAPVNSMYGSLPPVEFPCMVCISKDQANHFEALHNRPARVCYNGVDGEIYRPLGIPRTDRFLFCGRFSTIKGGEIGIQACKKAGVPLDLIGDCSITNEPDYLARCQKECDGKQIRMLGGQGRGSCVWWMSQANAFIHPARDFREPFGLAPVEAQLAGLPCITFDNGAMRETVKDGETGRVVKTVDQFVEALKEYAPPVSQKTRERCREWAMQFSVQAMAKRYEQLCEEAISGGW